MGQNSKIEWKDVPGFPGYRVNNLGFIASAWKRQGLGRGNGTTKFISSEWRPLKRSISHHGYAVVNLGRGNSRRICNLVLLAFVGPRPSGMECCHEDGNRLNDHLSNLRWDTSTANTDDQRAVGTLVGGERHGQARLTNDEIEQIRQIGRSMLQREIANLFGVRQSTISAILAQKSRTSSSHAGKGL